MKDIKKLGIFALIAMIVSSAIGGGAFNVSNSLAVGATPGGVIISWIIVGIGIFALVLSFNYLVLEKSELSGVSDYARAGFGDFSGFLSGWGYYLSAWLGNIAFAVLMMQTVGYFLPGFQTSKGSLTVLAVIVVSVISLLLTILVVRGVEGAAVINAIVMVAKLVPIAIFLVIAVTSFRLGIFTAHFWGNVVTNAKGAVTGATGAMSGSDFVTQFKSSLLVMVWLFVGVEGAAMMGDRAAKKSDAAKASTLGFLIILFIYFLLSVLPFGYLNQAQLAETQTPGLVYILKAMVGNWGGALMAAGLIISLLGAWLSWTMLPVEATSQLAEQQLLPSWFGKFNKNGAPGNSLWLTEVLVQVFLIITYFFANAYNVFLSLCTAVIMICYAFVGAYMLKIGIKAKKIKNIIIGLVALAFQLTALYLSGWQFVWMSLIAYAIGFVLFVRGKAEYGKKVSTLEWVLIVIFTLLALWAILALVLNQYGLRSLLGL